MRRLITINQGDTVHHPHHGIGLVQSISNRSFSGEKETPFAELYFERESLTLMLRTKDLAKTVRTPIGANQARDILDHLESWEGQMSSQWKIRASTNQEAGESGV